MANTMTVEPNQESCRETRRGVPRRSLLTGAALLAARPFATSAQPAGGGKTLAYVGACAPNGQGIHLFGVNPATGGLSPVKVFRGTSPGWLAFDPKKKNLYAANEVANFEGGTTGSVSAYAVDPANGDLTLLNTVTSGGAGPAHLSVDPRGQYVFVANYDGGSVAVLPVLAKGSLGKPTDIKKDNRACTPACAVGPTHAQNGPPGSFAISGHDTPHAHMIQADPAGNYVLAQDLGLDLTIVWKLNRADGTLQAHQTVPSLPGAGPRHFAFHPNGRWFYSLNEEASTLAFLTYNGATGMLSARQEISTLPPGFQGTSFTSEVIVSADGRFVYCCNRLHNTVATFAIDGTGRVKRTREEWTRGDYPSHCAIDPSGRFLYVCHDRSDNVTVFRIDRDAGALTFTGEYAGVGNPAVIAFLQV